MFAVMLLLLLLLLLRAIYEYSFKKQNDLVININSSAVEYPINRILLILIKQKRAIRTIKIERILLR